MVGELLANRRVFRASDPIAQACVQWLATKKAGDELASPEDVQHDVEVAGTFSLLYIYTVIMMMMMMMMVV